MIRSSLLFHIWRCSFSIDYGNGYAWSDPYLNISLGDTVVWSWSPPIGVTGVSFAVIQVQDPASSTKASDGFSSGASKSTGNKTNP